MTSYVPDLLEVIEEAFELCGLEATTGNDIRTARRSLNLLALDWSNRGLNLWTISEDTLDLTAGTDTYSLSPDVIDLIECVLSQDDTDYPINRVSIADYATIPNKTITGRPVEFAIERLVTPQLRVWPVPDQGYTLTFWKMEAMDKLAANTGTLPVPQRFVPAMIAGLAFEVAKKKAPDRVALLKADYDEKWSNAAGEDRDRSSFFTYPASC